MPYPISTPGQASASRNGKQWPAFPGIPIFLETHDERTAPKSYGTTPTTPTTPEILTHGRPAPSDPAYLTARDDSSLQHSPTTTIQTSSARSSVWPLPEPAPEVQQPKDQARPSLRFFPTQRPRIQLGSVPTLQIPQMPHMPQVDEKTPINFFHPGLGIWNGGEKPPSVEITPPLDEKVEKIEEETPNLAERIEQRLFQYSISGNIVKRWLLELVSWVFSALCMAAIIGVLIYLQDDKLSNWTLDKRTGLTLNAYISVLSKMAGAALILPVSEALGQLKWSWFLQHSKQMWDFEIFDNASRGPWGSLLLLIRTKGRALAALGALITLGLMTLDPFFQQVVDFPDRWALQDAPASVPWTERFETGDISVYSEDALWATADSDVGLVASKFFYGNGTQPIPFGNGTRPDIPLSCPTSNCTWPAYDTLGVCSECADVSNYLTYACVNGTVDWTSNLTGGYNVDNSYPNATMCGYFLNFTGELTTMMSGYLLEPETSEPGEALLVRTLPMVTVFDKTPVYGNGSIMFPDVRDPIADVLIVSAADGTASSVYRHEAPLAQECVISWCVKTIKSSYDWGEYNEEVLETRINTTAGPFPWQTMALDPSIEATNGTQIFFADDIHIHVNSTDANSTMKSYGTSNNTAYSIMVVFDDMFPSFYTAKDASAEPVLRFWTWKDGPAYTQHPIFNPWLAPNNISSHVGRLATAMTNVIRSKTGKKWIDGHSYSMENYVAVRWEWLTLPLGLLMMSLIFLAATVFKSAHEREQVGVLKNSAILTLLHGIPDNMRGKLTRSTSKGTPRAKAKELKVRLHPNLGWRVSGNVFSPMISRAPKAQPPPGWI
ncbi:hypothetical protein C7974DRAFT_163104 [Boeremia exigua]|uniref:uncharacterized protein n=1 Tax=Boeremia exigua TaxID=749465 RepID=UPI001E8CFE8F|nr:uncharacterized protein C7974DRAFT_163104 [Boeremia exigua]KAH6632986.1 hypothetical protein C7974DRAFT_163104 [Boeremia exigua]